MVNVIHTTRSTNGRWGLDIVSGSYRRDGSQIISPDGETCRFPLRGVVSDLGEVDGVRVLRIEHDPQAQTWLALDGELIDGGTTVVTMGLQSHRETAVHILGPVALLRYYGYKGRSSWTVLIKDGQEQELTPSQLLALGLIQPETPPAQEQALTASPLSGAMAEALKKAGLA